MACIDRIMFGRWGIGPAGPAIVAGGLYATRSEKNDGYSILKVLAFEDGVVNVRLYANRFAEVPERIDAGTLNLGEITLEAIESKTLGPIGIGHMPFTAPQFLSWKPVFVQQEVVTEEERERVQEWKDAGGGVIGGEPRKAGNG
jgi:hypothetical protein